ncbi:hypothetical protein J4437_05695 [Candidatus Woesearchaeota archaeon]|nr:hypothetical protein [Candidatus Woesearchaeota archaeon]
MALYEKKWWQNLFKKKEEKQEDVLHDVEAILEFLKDVPDESRSLIPLFKQLEDLESERQVASEHLAKINLETQSELLEKILDRYGALQNDADINGIRVKRIALEFLKKAKKVGLKDLVAEKEQESKWRLEW